MADSRRVVELENKVAMLEMKVQLLTAQMEILNRERDTLARQLDVQNEHAAMLMRLLPVQSSAKRSEAAAQQRRDASGRFAGTGKGVSSLIPDATEDKAPQQGSLI